MFKIKHCGRDATFNVYDFSKLMGGACNVFLSEVFHLDFNKQFLVSVKMLFKIGFILLHVLET